MAVAGIVGLGRFLADRPDVLALLHAYAGDPRWRVREGVAMALQRGGAADPAALIVGLEPWVLDADPLVQRAVVAALCEPALLVDEAVATRVVAVLDEVTVSLLGRADRRAEGVWVLRQALGYGWSVAIVAAPGAGMRAFERWIADTDPDARWIVRENLGKVRLAKPDPVWVAAALRRVQLSSPGS